MSPVNCEDELDVLSLKSVVERSCYYYYFIIFIFIVICRSSIKKIHVYILATLSFPQHFWFKSTDLQLQLVLSFDQEIWCIKVLYRSRVWVYHLWGIVCTNLPLINGFICADINIYINRLFKKNAKCFSTSPMKVYCIRQEGMNGSQIVLKCRKDLVLKDQPNDLGW